jgi:hypothetical protein
VDVVTIRLHPVTGVCLAHLAEQLEAYADRKLKIGAFAAASNVTGEPAVLIHSTIRYDVIVNGCINDSLLPSPALVLVLSCLISVAGLLTDVDAVSVALHRAGGIVVFDYAAAAPYVKVQPYSPHPHSHPHSQSHPHSHPHSQSHPCHDTH